MAILSQFFITLVVARYVTGLDNGLARTPPMGWMAWERFRCNTDCKNDPDNCLSEKLFTQMADHIVSDGYKDVGYNYVSIDDCYLEKSRDSSGRLQPAKDRFPNGIKYLADYMHARGLKLGIYEDYGTKTCGGYPGSQGHEKVDAETFAKWEVDMLKFDGCYSNESAKAIGYPLMGKELNQTGRPILYSCSWPAYLDPSKVNYTALEYYCNVWRNYGDVQDSWDSVLSIINFYGKNVNNFSTAAGPGHFNDPDMLIIGGYGLSYEQQRSQMALWAMMAAPLFMSADLRSIRPESKEILLNKNVIAINQDPMGIAGTRIYNANNIQLWTRPISPKGRWSFVVLYTGVAGEPVKVSWTLRQMGFVDPSSYVIQETFTAAHMGTFKPDDHVTFRVNPTGVFMGTVTPIGTRFMRQHQDDYLVL